MSIASADANEVVGWGRDAVLSQGDKIRLSKNMARAVSSIKMKATRDGIDLELKLLDKLKAIELYFKLCGEDVSGDAQDTLNICYSYVSASSKDNG